MRCNIDIDDVLFEGNTAEFGAGLYFIEGELHLHSRVEQQ